MFSSILHFTGPHDVARENGDVCRARRHLEILRRRAARIHPLSILVVCVCYAFHIPRFPDDVVCGGRVLEKLSNLGLTRNLTRSCEVSGPLLSLPYEVGCPVSQTCRLPRVASTATIFEGQMKNFERIAVDPAQMGGVPCVRHLRIPVATVLACTLIQPGDRGARLAGSQGAPGKVSVLLCGLRGLCEIAFIGTGFPPTIKHPIPFLYETRRFSLLQ